MKTRLAAACAISLAIFAALGTPASAHRLDEYLQATTISLEQDHVQAQMRLTPGVAVFPGVFASMDTNRDGILAADEQQAYAERVLHDLSLAIDNNRLPLRLASWKFPPIGEMKAGRGEIQLDFTADAPRGDHNRKLIFENHHQPRIAVYLVNCLVPRDPNIQVTGQKRNYLQSRYELDYTQAYALAGQQPAVGRRGRMAWAGAVLLLLSAQFAWLWRLRARSESKATASKDGVSAHKAVSPEGRSV